MSLHEHVNSIHCVRCHVTACCVIDLKHDCIQHTYAATLQRVFEWVWVLHNLQRLLHSKNMLKVSNPVSNLGQ